MELNVNIDHIATVRNARGGFEPDPVTGAAIAELAGASGVVCHLREDRRHINDHDLKRIRETVQTKLDLEMAANEEIIKIALDTVPDLVTIVPEKRQELTTEGGLNVAGDIEKFKSLSDRMHEKRINVSFFIEPDIHQIEAVIQANGDMVEFHTGTYANAKHEDEIQKELSSIQIACQRADEAGLKIAAGHGLNYHNTPAICQFPQINELSIGHSIISRAVFSGLEKAIKDMLQIMNNSIIADY